jgi:hypothetical protein
MVFLSGFPCSYRCHHKLCRNAEGGGATIHHHKEVKINAAAAGGLAGGAVTQSTRIDDM